MNAEAIPPPSVYRAAQSGQPAAKPTLWSKATVRRILSNSTYVGDMEQGRVRKLNYKSKKTIRLPRDEWIIVPGTHEGIISRRRFAAVQKQLAARSRAAHGETQHPLAGLVRCGMCGGKMELTGSGPRRYYRCCTAAKSRAACPGQPYLSMHDIEKLVQSKLQTYTPQPLTYALVNALIQTIIVSPPENDQRTIKIIWRF